VPSTIWNGSLAFGLVNVPVKLYATASSSGVRFNEFDRDSGSRVRHKRVREGTDAEVAYDDIVKGHELDDGRVVIVERAELDALAPGRSKVIEIEDFVPLAEVDPVVFDRSYYLGPAGDRSGGKPYELLRRAMVETGRVGVARFVLRNRSHLCVVRPTDEVLILHTLVYADDLRPASDVPDLPEDVEISEREMATAVTLIDSLTADFDHAAYTDTYEDAVLDLIERKAEGESVLPAPEGEERPAEVVDLAAALEASVDAARQRRKAS
jgi:DNA end-binding protein Ku